MKKTLRIAPLLVAFPFIAAACAPVETLEPLEDGEESTGEAEDAVYSGCAGTYPMRPAHSGLCLAPTSGSLAAPSWVGQYECTCPANALNQWYPIPVTSPALIVSIRSHRNNPAGDAMCIDRPNGSTATHTPLQSYPCHYGPAQQWLMRVATYNGKRYWQYEAAHTVAGGGYVASGKCIDVPSHSTGEGTTFQLYPCKTTSDPNPLNQYFLPLW